MRYTTSCNTQSSAPEDGRDHRPKHVELIGIINKLLLLHLVGVYIVFVLVFNLNVSCLQTANCSAISSNAPSLYDVHFVCMQSCLLLTQKVQRVFSVFVLHSPVPVSMTCTATVTVYGVDKLLALFKKYICCYSIDLHILRH